LRLTPGQEEVVEDGQADEESVKDARKLLRQEEGEDHDAVREQSGQTDSNLGNGRYCPLSFVLLFPHSRPY
jgi:hypothetical protein